jgi:hypothetical protein
MNITAFTTMTTLALLLAAPAMRPAQAEGPVQLITKAEADLPTQDSVGGQDRNLTRGPGVDRVAPAVVGADQGPFRFAVRFKPRNGVPIDPDSVRVTYRRQPAVDLTPRVKPFITAEGIEAPAVIVPPGKHVIDIEVTDKQGRPGRGQLTLTVDAPR